MNTLTKHKFFRIAASFVIVVTAYFAYAAAVVPWIEPSVDAHGFRVGHQSGSDQPDTGPKYYQRLFSEFFPDENSWVRQNPKMLESDQGMLLIKDYRNLGDGKIELTPFAMILFPSNEVKTNPDRVGEALVMQAPQAILQFDNALDLTRAKIGNLRSGQLVGEVVIRSHQKLPTSDDDLHITTRHVQLSEDRITTDERVDFRLGPNFGGGKKMIIRLIPKHDTKIVGHRGPNVGGIGSFELIEQVRMQFQIGGRGLLPSQNRQGPQKQGRKQNHKKNRKQTPLQITSAGPFRFDFNRHVATFTDQVKAKRIHPSGMHDQLSCDLLAIYFTPKQETPPAGENTDADRPSNAFASLQAQRLYAEGSPILVQSPSTDASARCRRLDYNLQTEKIELQDEDDRVMLRYRTNTIRAPRVSYQPGKSGKIGLVMATGPGELHGSTDGNRDQQYHATWKQEMRIRPDQGQQLLSLLGGASFSHDRSGSLAAQEIWLWLTEMPRPQKAALAKQAPGDVPTDDLASQFDKIDVRPHRMAALGDVRIDSPELTGNPQRFEVWFQHAPPADDNLKQLNQLNPKTSRTTSVVPPEQPRRTKPGRSSRDDRPKRQFQMTCDLLQVDVLMRGRRAEIENADLIGNARLRETQTAEPDEEPLVVVADKVKVTGANTEKTVIKVTGHEARVEGRGLIMLADEINLDRHQNKLWINGPGSMSLLTDRDLQGKRLAKQQQIDIRWKRGMMFDGQEIAYSGAVEAISTAQHLSTEELQIHLDQFVAFNRPAQGREQIKLHRLACQGGVLLENRTVTTDADGNPQVDSIDRITAKTLEVDHLSGKIFAQGPGFLKSVHRGSAGMKTSPFGATARRTSAENRAKKKPKPADQLNYLEVVYQREITGNLLDRELIFSDQVRGIRGPIDNWKSTLDMDDPAGLRKNDVAITCDRLTISQTLGSRSTAGQKKQRGPLELEAFGNTLVEGSGFTARAHRITYAEAKDLLVLEGTGRSDARLWRQTRPGIPPTQAAARKILYWRATNRVEVDDAKYLNLGQLPAP